MAVVALYNTKVNLLWTKHLYSLSHSSQGTLNLVFLFFTHVGPTMRAHINRLGSKKWVLKYLCLYVKAATLCQCYVEPELAQKLLDQFCSNSHKTYKISQKDTQNVNFLKLENQTIFGQNFLFSRSSVYFMNTRLWAFFCEPQIAKSGFEVETTTSKCTIWYENKGNRFKG